MRRTVATVLLVVIALVGCGSNSSSSTSTSSSTSSPSTSSSSTLAITGDLTVFAAASLTESFDDEQTALQGANPGVKITYSFAGSDALVTQVQNAAPADVIATASAGTMKTLSDAGLVETVQTFARNKLEILVQPGNPKAIKTFADLARTDITFVTEEDTVPAGKYTAQMLQTAGITVSPVSKETDVKSAVARVTSGEADATVVYVTDVLAAGSKGLGVEIPDAQNVIATYPIAIVKGATDHAAAEAFIAAILSSDGQANLSKHGFLAAA
jgi:molybdate transport system substrate-binding protein